MNEEKIQEIETKFIKLFADKFKFIYQLALLEYDTEAKTTKTSVYNNGVVDLEGNTISIEDFTKILRKSLEE